MKIRDLIDFNDLPMREWEGMLSTTNDIIRNQERYHDACKGKILATLFFEPSTRTMMSFQAAMLRMGGQIIGISDPKSSSVAKGEVLRDTIKVISGYSDIIAIRHALEGTASAAALYSDVPVINAGDGRHLHPTQTLADLATIAFERGEIANLTVGICGDLKNGRTVHSLIKALSRFPKIGFTLISPPNLRIPDYLTKMMDRKGISYQETENFEGAIGDLDILYMTRIQIERFSDREEYERCKGVYILDAAKMRLARKDMLVFHPLPRVDEITYDVDGDPRAMYFKQAKYGVYIRMALILRMLEGPLFENGDDDGFSDTAMRCTNERCITNTEIYLPQRFKQVKSAPDILYCAYCEKQYKKENGDG